MGMVLAFVIGAIVGITIMCIAITWADDEEDERK